MKLGEVSTGTYVTERRASAEALFRDLTDGWIITAQNGLIDCIEAHLSARDERIRSEALREAVDCNGCWLDDDKYHPVCQICKRGNTDMYKTVEQIKSSDSAAIIAAEPKEYSRDDE
jgi:hypothetical protein